MSNVMYNELWKQAETLFTETIQLDTVYQGAKPQKDRKKAHDTVSLLYVKYILIYNKLEECYDQMIQSQKRILIKKSLNATLGRILELKHELVNIDLSEHSYYDDVLIECGVTPQETEIRVPRYYKRERITEIKEKRKYIEDTLRDLGMLHEIVVPQKITESQAIRLIQAHERARQGRLRYQFIKEIRAMKEKSTIKLEVEDADEANSKTAVLKIQKIWRGYITRRAIQKRRLEEMLLIGNITVRKESRI